MADFRIVEEIGRGTHGCIMTAMDDLTKTKVVLKKISKKGGLDAIEQEMSANELMNDERGTCLYHGYIDAPDHVVSLDSFTL